MAVPPRALSRPPTGSDRQDALASRSPAGTLRRKISKPASLVADAQSAISPIFMTTIARAQAQAQAFLRSAIASERAKRWNEAIEYYRRLLNCLNKRNFPLQYIPGPACKLLVFETYYHLGVALQNIGNHHEALEEFTLALETAYIPKNVCQVGCASGSFYQIPVLGRRAYSYVKCDRIKDAIRDSTRAVHLDPSNPAFALSWDSKNFSDVEDFYNPKISSFYDKFLWSLNAFHTITEINLFDGATFAANLKKDLSSSLTWGFENEELISCEENEAKTFLKKASNSVDWVL